MEYKFVKGKKSNNDVVLLVKTDGWELLSFTDILRILKACFENEDRLYPPPRFKGRRMLFEAIRDIYNGKSIAEAIGKYKLKTDKLKLHAFI